MFASPVLFSWNSRSVHTMSSTAAASAYWRVAGLSYLQYSNLCATMVRDALKEPMKESAKAREIVFFKNITYKDGKPSSQGGSLRVCWSNRGGGLDSLGCESDLPSFMRTQRVR